MLIKGYISYITIMAAHSTNPPLKRGVTIQLDDGTQIALSREVASKLNLIRSPLEYLLNIEGKTEDEAYKTVIPVDYYPAQNIRQYLKLMAKIDKREELANIRLSQLFGLLLDAMYMGNETSITNLADYILATVYASREMADNVKAEIRRMYLSGPAEPKRLIQRRLTELNQTPSLKRVRDITPSLNWSGQSSLSFQHMAIDGQGRIVAVVDRQEETRGQFPPGYYHYHRFKTLYDETDPQRGNMINSIYEHNPQVRIQVGGARERGITIVEGNQRGNTWDLWKYLPGLNGESTIAVDSHNWKLTPFGSRLIVPSLTDIKIYDLNNNSLLFQKELPQRQLFEQGQFGEIYSVLKVVHLDKRGRYLFITHNVLTTRNVLYGDILELFDIDRPGDKRLFEILLTKLVNNAVIDPYRKIIYIFQDKLAIGLPGGASRLVKVMSIVGFNGEVLHRYIYPAIDTIIPYPGPKHLLTHEREVRGIMGRPLTYGLDIKVADIICDFYPPAEDYKVGHLTPAKLPNYEIWPSPPPTRFGVNREGEAASDNFWIRDVNDEFKVKALVGADKDAEDEALISPNGDYIILSDKSRFQTAELTVFRTVLYSDEETQVIRNILQGEKTAKLSSSSKQ